MQLLFVDRQLHDPLCFDFFIARSDHAGNTSASEAPFRKTQDLDKEKSGPCDVCRLSVKYDVSPL